MSKIRIKSIKIKNYRSFGVEQEFKFLDNGEPTTIIGYNNCGKTNLINAIRYGLYETMTSDTFDVKDFHNCDLANLPSFSVEYAWTEKGKISLTHSLMYSSFNNENNLISYIKPIKDEKWNIKNKTQVFYINFHKIKEEIVTQKSSWGSIKSFLGKHIKNLMEKDKKTKDKKDDFKAQTKASADQILKESKLEKFIGDIKTNYNNNLRQNAIAVEFGLPDYEDIFLQMVFKIGIGGDSNKLVPLDHFGDGYISMFVMAVIQAIAEDSSNDSCLFLFEEPESFLHENHQEYFYKNVLCPLAKNHQVIYTTHSHKMVDIQNAQNIIRLELENGATVSKYNNTTEFIVNPVKSDDLTNGEFNLANFNNLINIIEPSISKILFSQKAILVEGPNDVMVYRHLIEKKAKEKYLLENPDKLEEAQRYGKTYLSFHNFVIICHHGKGTAYILAQVCKHFGLNYFMINDWDFDFDFIKELKEFDGKEKDWENLPSWGTIKTQKKKNGDNYKNYDTIKGMITTNKNLLNEAENFQIHFNVKKLETLLGCTDKDKDALKVWNKLQEIKTEQVDKLFPSSLVKFLEL